jgi:hypothetical protein
VVLHTTDTSRTVPCEPSRSARQGDFVYLIVDDLRRVDILVVVWLG